MRRRGPILALAVVLLALPLGAGGADAARSDCQKLDATHDLAPAKRVKLVRVPNDRHGNDLVGCVLPRGKVRFVAAKYSDTPADETYRLRQVSGHFVLVTSTTSGGDADVKVTKVVDLKRGFRYTVAFRCLDPDICGEGDESAKRAFVNSAGQAVAAITSTSSDIVSIVGFSASGRRLVLDTGTRTEIPPSSLELDGHVASWTKNGMQKSVRLPRVTACERLRGKDDLARAKRVKLVERRNDEGGTDLVGCVLPGGKVSVVASRVKDPGEDRRYRVLEVEGHMVLVRGVIINQYGRGVSTYVYDLKRARSYNVAETCFDDNGVACKPQTRAVRALVNAQGQAAAIVSTDGSTKRYVMGFKSTGKAAVLDSGTAAEIPARSLRLDGHEVTWTHSGAPRGATLEG